VKAATDSYRMDMDVLARFIDEECDTGAGLRVKTSRLYGRYKVWCEESGEQVMRSQDFSQSLQDRGYSRGKSDGTRVYRGIGLGENEPSTTTSGAHGADKNHYRPELSPHGEQLNSSAPCAPDRVEEVRAAMLDTFDELGIKTSEPETIAKVLHESGSLPYAPSTELIEAARGPLTKP
jgi:hypothetical protein